MATEVFCYETADKSGEYAPYQHNRTYIPISEPLKANDEICVQNGEYGAFRKRSLQLFNGTEDGWQYTNGTFRYTLPYLKVPNVDETNYLCDYFTPINYSASWSNYETFVSNVSDVVVFKIPTITTVEAWKAWLAENPIKFEYELKTPVFEPFADQTPFYNLLSYEDVTNVSIVELADGVEPTLQMFYPSSEDGVNVFSLLGGNNKNLYFDEENGGIYALNGVTGEYVKIYNTPTLPLTQLLLYSYGTEYVPFTLAGVLTIGDRNSDHVCISITCPDDDTYNLYGSYFTTNPVDVTNYNKLCITYKGIGPYSGNLVGLYTKADGASASAYTRKLASVTEPTTVEIDVTSAEGEYYIYGYADMYHRGYSPGAIYIYDIHLE